MRQIFLLAYVRSSNTYAYLLTGFAISVVNGGWQMTTDS